MLAFEKALKSFWLTPLSGFAIINQTILIMALAECLSFVLMLAFDPHQAQRFPTHASNDDASTVKW